MIAPGTEDKERGTFSNNAFTNNQLPSLTTLTYQPLVDTYLNTRRLVSLFSTMIILLISFIFQKQPTFPLSSQTIDLFGNLTLVVGFLGMIDYFYVIFADRKKTFALREQDITYRSGLIFQKTVTQPILRIQHVELKRGPIERKVGLASLQLFSAGGAAHTFEIPGLLLENAESIRQFILDHKAINNN